MSDVRALVGSQPSQQRWVELVQVLSGLDGAALVEAMEAARAVLSWPARLRRVEGGSPWLAGLFDGVRDPRLGLVGWASVEHLHKYDYLKGVVSEEQLLDVLAAFARRLDPAFDPPNDVLEQGDDIRYANACGGGRAWEKRGSAEQGVEFRDEAVEHAADMENDGSWVAYGLSDGCSLGVRRQDYIGGQLIFSAAGPAPAIFEVAEVWGAMTRERMDLGEVLRRVNSATGSRGRGTA